MSDPLGLRTAPGQAAWVVLKPATHSWHSCANYTRPYQYGRCLSTTGAGATWDALGEAPREEAGRCWAALLQLLRFHALSCTRCSGLAGDYVLWALREEVEAITQVRSSHSWLRFLAPKTDHYLVPVVVLQSTLGECSAMFRTTDCLEKAFTRNYPDCVLQPLLQRLVAVLAAAYFCSLAGPAQSCARNDALRCAPLGAHVHEAAFCVLRDQNLR